MPEPRFETLPEELRLRLCAPYLQLTPDRTLPAFYAKAYDVIRFSSTLTPTERLIYCDYAHRIRRTSAAGCEIKVRPADIRFQHGLSQQQMHKLHRRLKLLRLLARYLPNGELTLWMPEQLTVGHLFLLQPNLLEWSAELRRELSAVALALPHSELFLPWLRGNFSAQLEECSRTTGGVLKHNLRSAQKLAEIAVSPLVFPPSTSGHSFCDRDRERGSAPSARPLFSQPDLYAEQDSAVPHPPLRDLDGSADDPTPADRNGVPPSVQDVFRRALAHKPPEKPLKDLVATLPDAMDELPPDLPHRRVAIEQGPTRPRWPVVYWTRYLILHADANQVPLWCDEEGKARTTRGVLYQELPIGAAVRKTIRQLLELMLIRIFNADARDPHADLSTLQALALTLREMFRDWNNVCVSYLKKPDGMAFNPSYLVKAFAAVQEWFLSSRVASDTLPLEQYQRLYLERQDAVEAQRRERRLQADEARYEQEFDS